ncbi:hypothetical protein KGY71_04645, partial [Candidatus Bipolaricaulota bacterium]|nr:hypothetical protein [Candidatus Bipolaricaulota bacterium]
SEVDFSYSGDFGKSSVFVLPSPYFVSRVQLKVGEGSENEIGLREASLYLERNEFISIVTRLKGNLSVKNEERDQELKVKLEEARFLDPYSPTTDYLLAEVYSGTGDYESAMVRIDRALKNMEAYGDFLVPRVDFNDLFRRKARIAGELGEWATAIRYMEKATPEVDRDFLSEIYLSRFDESGSSEDLDSSFLNAVLAYRDRPRLVLGVLRKYSKQESWLGYGLNYFSERVQESEAGSYRLEDGRKVSPYLINLSVALLEFWRGGKGSFDQAIDHLTAAEESTDNTEKLAMVDSIKGRLYRSEGEEGRAEQYKERALEYFSDYSSLYDEWIGFLGAG